MFRGRHSVLALPLVLALSGCGIPGFGSDVEVGTIGYVEGFLGGAAADEPRAAVIARDILSAGGSAGDAAVAGFFALAVTLPSSVGLGGGGVCTAWNARIGEIQVIDFSPEPIAASRGRSRDAAIPTSVRGMFALHARYGRFRWSQLITPAENLARFGTQTSRALAQEIEAYGPAKQKGHSLASLFNTPAGRKRAEGDPLSRLDLAAVMGQIRARGAGALYIGPLANRILEAYDRAGVDMTKEELRDYSPSWVRPSVIDFGDHVMGFSPGPQTDGPLALEAVNSLVNGVNFLSGGASGERNNMLMSVAGDSRSSGTKGGGAAGLVTVDPEGNAIACTFTLGRAFGTGHLAPGTGIVIGAVRDSKSPAALSAIVANLNRRDFYAATTGVDAGAAAGVAWTVLRTLNDKQAIREALAAKPASHGRVLAMICPSGLPTEERDCAVSADPAGHGLAMQAEVSP